MISLLVWTLFAFGTAMVIGHSKISLPFRMVIGGTTKHRALVPWVGPFLVALVECPMCIGVWQGAAFGYFFWAFVPLVAPELVDVMQLGPEVVGALVMAFVTSASNLLLSRYMGLM